MKVSVAHGGASRAQEPYSTQFDLVESDLGDGCQGSDGAL